MGITNRFYHVGWCAGIAVLLLSATSAGAGIVEANPETASQHAGIIWADMANQNEGPSSLDTLASSEADLLAAADGLATWYFDTVIRPPKAPAVGLLTFGIRKPSPTKWTLKGFALPDKYDDLTGREFSASLAWVDPLSGVRLGGPRRDDAKTIDYGAMALGSPAGRGAVANPLGQIGKARFDFTNTVQPRVGVASLASSMIPSPEGGGSSGGIKSEPEEEEEEIRWIVFEAASTDGKLSAEVRFWQEGTQLKIMLTNTSMTNPLTDADILTALFFNVDNQPTLTPVTAILGPNSVLLYPQKQPSDGVTVGGEWAYRAGDVKSPMEYGLSATGFNAIFKPADRFPGESLINNGNSMSDMKFGLVGPGKVLVGKDKAMYESNPFIMSSIIFTLDGLPETFDLLFDITNVWFQYGTATNAPSLTSTRNVQRWEEEIINPPQPPDVPEPAPLGLLAIGATALLRRRRR